MYHFALPASSTPLEGEGHRFQFADLLAVIRRRYRLILGVAAGCLAVVALVLMLLPTMYSGTAVIMLEQRKNNVADAASVLTSLPTDATSVQNQIQILTSRDLASRVVSKLGLDNDPEFAGFLTSAAPVSRERIIDTFLGRLSVENEGLSTAIAIRFQARSPDKAAAIANAVADTYVASQLETKFAATREATGWLEGRVRELSKQVQAADAAVERYKAENDLTDTAGGVPLVDQQIGAISAQLVQAKADLAEKQATFSRVAALTKSGHGADISQAVASPLIIQLRAQEADVIRNEAELATKYGPKHPKLLAVESQRRDLKQKIREEVSRLAGSLANDVAVARSQVGSLDASLVLAERHARGENLLRVKLKSLEVNAASTRSIYEAFAGRLRAIQDQNAIEMSDARVISHAAAPNTPSSPRRPLIFAASIPFALLLGLLAALLAERFAPAVSSAPNAGIPVLARISGAGHPRAADLMLTWRDSPYAKAIGQLAGEIARQAAAGGPRVILVTSAQAGEGAATIAVSLARAASALGCRVVLLDGDLAAPSLPSLTAVDGAAAGLPDVLAGRNPLSRTMMRDSRSNVLLLASVQPYAQGLPLLVSRQFRALLNHLRQRCDLLFIVAPPVLQSPVAQVLAQQTDAVMLVVRDDVALHSAVSAAVKALIAVPAPPIGMVLTA